MMYTSKISIQISLFLLILLWVYSALTKLLDFDIFQQQMLKQVLPLPMKSTLVFTLPPFELAVAGTIVIERTRWLGLLCSLTLLTAFTIYVGLAAFHFLPKRPCSCGGIIQHIGWKAHFWFNLFFLFLNMATIINIKKGGN